ncbi:16S rRNA (cytidine(1402)-2'-O)-methyltransferase [Patescibacteria group bacterium]|nr:16S rRNA (cytidine(1402)-2'-O)-methyltransferase [Patescibacteria group bacterium]
MLGILYIVATPIGNLEDITLRAIETLGKVDIILAEDTRVTGKLLNYLSTNYQLPPTKLLSYHAHSREDKKLAILKHLMEGKDLALVTDAGTPGISDPGNELVDFLLSYKDGPCQGPSLIKIVPVPGASAITSALSVSGFRTNKFVFLGFLPKRKRKKLFEWLKGGKISFAFYESPKRILKTLNVLSEYFSTKTEFRDGFDGDELLSSEKKEKRIFIARELTKMHETLYRGTISEVREQLLKDKIKGEMVVVVEG